MNQYFENLKVGDKVLLVSTAMYCSGTISQKHTNEYTNNLTVELDTPISWGNDVFTKAYPWERLEDGFGSMRYVVPLDLKILEVELENTILRKAYGIHGKEELDTLRFIIKGISEAIERIKSQTRVTVQRRLKALSEDLFALSESSCDDIDFICSLGAYKNSIKRLVKKLEHG